jgi:hypothetical protein
MSAIENTASRESLDFRTTLRTRLGLEVDEVSMTQAECSADIERMKAQFPATQPQKNLASMLVRDHYPTMAIPPTLNSDQASKLIRKLQALPPTPAMLIRLHNLETAAGIKNPNPPRVTASCYQREQDVKNRLSVNDIDFLISAKDAVTADWGLVAAEQAPATEYTDEDSVPESENTSVRTNSRTKAPSA